MFSWTVVKRTFPWSTKLDRQSSVSTTVSDPASHDVWVSPERRFCHPTNPRGRRASNRRHNHRNGHTPQKQRPQTRVSRKTHPVPNQAQRTQNPEKTISLVRRSARFWRRTGRMARSQLTGLTENSKDMGRPELESWAEKFQRISSIAYVGQNDTQLKSGRSKEAPDAIYGKMLIIASEVQEFKSVLFSLFTSLFVDANIPAA